MDYVSGASKEFNLGVAEIFKKAGGAVDLLNDGLEKAGMPRMLLQNEKGDSHAADQAIDFLKKTGSDIPQTIGGKIIGSVFHTGPDIFTMMAAPEIGIGASGLKVPRFTTFMAVKEGLGGYEQDRTIKSAVDGFIMGAIEGQTMHMLGYGGSKFGQYISGITKDKVIGGASGAVATSLLFGGHTAATDYLNTGKIDLDNFLVSA